MISLEHGSYATRVVDSQKPARFRRSRLIARVMGCPPTGPAGLIKRPLRNRTVSRKGRVMSETFPYTQAELFATTGVPRYATSFVIQAESAFWLDANEQGHKWLWLLTPADHAHASRFEGEAHPWRDSYILKKCPL